MSDAVKLSQSDEVYFHKQQGINTDIPLWLKKFINVYQSLGVKNLHNLKAIYHSDIHFKDPLHDITGFNALEHYFSQLYTHVSSCQFIITEVVSDKENAAIYWEMNFTHSQLNKGKPVLVEGHSQLKGGDDGVYFHRDYVDLGAMLYEQIPLLGGVVKAIKKRAVK